MLLSTWALKLVRSSTRLVHPVSIELQRPLSAGMHAQPLLHAQLTFYMLCSGWLMADPHPGNLIRTPDGRLAILDFGLMVEIDDDIK